MHTDSRNFLRVQNARVRARRTGIFLGVVLLATVLNGCEMPVDKAAEPEAVGGPALLRRLTESQYRASIADIFSPDVPVVARFEKQLRSEGLIAVGTGEAGMSPFSVEQYDNAALGVAETILSEDRRADFVPCTPEDEQTFDASCAAEFIQRYGPVLFRRPLSDEQKVRYLEVARLGAAELGGFYQGLQYALVGMMTAPQFLLRIEQVQTEKNADGEAKEIQRLDAWSMATRLSYFLTNSTPDAELLRAAAAGELDSADGLARQVDRLIASPAFEAAVRAFFRDMLEFDLFEDLAKDAAIYPAYNSTVAADAQEQTLLDIVELLVEQKGDYRDLFTLSETHLTRALGIIYQQPVAPRKGWQKTQLSYQGDRVGIQSHISFVALHAHPGRSSPSLRGAALRKVFLCQEVPDPPADVDFSAVQDASSEQMPTARHRLAVHNSQPACAGCHKIMDPVGLGLENYDGLGTFRSQENNVRIDASGSLDGIDYENPEGLGQALHDHPETARCAVEKLYRFAVGRDTVWYERDYMDYLINTFASSGYQFPELMRTIALSKNFYAIAEAPESQNHIQMAGVTDPERNPL